MNPYQVNPLLLVFTLFNLSEDFVCIGSWGKKNVHNKNKCKQMKGGRCPIKQRMTVYITEKCWKRLKKKYNTLYVVNIFHTFRTGSVTGWEELRSLQQLLNPGKIIQCQVSWKTLHWFWHLYEIGSIMFSYFCRK